MLKGLSEWKSIVASLGLVLGSNIAHAYVLDEGGPSDEETIADAISKGDVLLDLRMRYEDASVKEPIEQGAQALTLRTRLSFETQRYNLFSAGLRFDHIQAIPDDENYFSGSNGQHDDLVVADPELTEVSAAWVAYDIANTLFKFGKQEVQLNEGRLLGANEWRQNTNTYRGISIKNESLNYTRFEFARFTRFENAYDPDSELGTYNTDIRLFNLSYRGFWLNDFSVYGLSLNGHDQRPDWSTETYGIRFDGEAGDRHLFKLYLDYALQSDKYNNPVDYKAKYIRADLSFAYSKRFGAKLAYEKLGADGNGFFVTPLANLHDFQGATNTFYNGGLGNISGGIRDYSVQLFAGCNEEFVFTLDYHRFKSDDSTTGLGDLGREIIAALEYSEEDYTLAVKYADYDADDFGVDQQRAWVSASYRL